MDGVRGVPEQREYQAKTAAIADTNLKVKMV